MQIGERRIRGIIREKEEAKKTSLEIFQIGETNMKRLQHAQQGLLLAKTFNRLRPVENGKIV